MISKIPKILAAVVSGARQTTCEACGKVFGCGASLTGCWCAQIKLTEDTRTLLRTRYSDCLCQSCLEEAASKQAALQVTDEPA